MWKPNVTLVVCLAIATLLTAGACGRSGERARTDTATGTTARAEPGSLEGARTDTTRKDTAAMSGMAGMMGGQMAAMMDSVGMRIRMMDSMTATQMKDMLPMYRQMVANMLAQMNQEMRSMNMPADRAWTATIDSLRQDLVRMPDMSAAGCVA